MSKVPQLVSQCGPVRDASALAAFEIERAISEQRAMSIWIDRSLGTQEAGLALVDASHRAAVVFAHPIPAELCEVAEPEWHDQVDVLRALGIPTQAPFRRNR